MKNLILLAGVLVILPSAFSQAFSRNGKLPGYTDSSVCPTSYEEIFACRNGSTRNGSSVTVVVCQNNTGEGILITKDPGLHDLGFFIQKIKEFEQTKLSLRVYGLSYSGQAENLLTVYDDSFRFNDIRVELNTCSN